MGAKSINMD
jgi:hypothetical protein